MNDTTTTTDFRKSTLFDRILSHGRVAALALAASVAVGISPVSANNVKGYLYTSLNGEGINQVVSFERLADGSLGHQRIYSTGALGGANRKAGGDAAGDFDAQGAIQLIDEHLLVVNAGGNTVTVFKVDKNTGALTKTAEVDSMGIRPVSIAYVQKPSSHHQYWVVVGNQWNNPNVQKGGEGEGPIEMYPNPMFHADGGEHEKVLDDRNIYLFSFDSESGQLKPEVRLDSYNGTNGGPTTVAFNSDATKLAVATWGIAHFATKTPTHQKPSRVYVYDFDAASGRVGNARFFEEEGISGSIGFSWDKRISNLYVSNFNLTPEKRDHSLTVLNDTGQSVRKIAHFGTGNGDDIDEACWTILNAKGDKLYVSSFGGNLLSVFDVSPTGIVSKIGSNSETVYVNRKPGTPAGDTKDMYISEDGKHLYNLGAYQTFTISAFDVSNNGQLSYRSEYRVGAATQAGAGSYNFLGLAGFDKN